MAKEAPLRLFFLSVLIVCSSGTLLGFSYRERGETGTTALAETISFLEQNKVFPSQIRVFVTDHRILSTLKNSEVSVDFYLNKSLFGDFINSKPSALSWLKTNLIDFLTQVNIKSIIATCGSECFGPNGTPLLLSALGSVHSAVSKFHLGREVKISVAFSLSFLEKLNKSHENDLHKILSFIKKMNSFITIEDSIDGELSMGDQFVHYITERAVIAASILPCKDVPMVLTMKSSAIPSSMEVAKFGDRVSKYLEANTQITGRIVALYAREDFAQKEMKREEEEIFPSYRREILSKFLTRRTLDDTTNPATTVFPTPVMTPPDTPTIITVPATNPVTVSPTNPAAMPVTVPSTTPAPLTPTNPASTPVPVVNPVPMPTPITVPGSQPVTNPVTSYPPPGVPISIPVAPPANTNAPATTGQSWCVARTGAPETALQSALDYACGMGGADCSQIQPAGNCYNPNTLQNHASFAFNSYYQKNPTATSCDFGGTATIVNANPSTGSCIYALSSTPATSSSTPTSSSSTPIPTPTTTSSGYGTPPSVLNSSNPASSDTMPVFGSETPPVVNTTTASHSAGLQPFVGCMILVISLVTGKLNLLA